MMQIFIQFLFIFLFSASAFSAPKNQMRQMLTERPNKISAATTLDAGHFMFESNLASFTKDNENQTKTAEFSAFSTLTLRAGLTSNFEAQAMFDAYKNNRQKSASGLNEKDGFGDLTIRLKRNFFGNNGEKYALSLVSFVKIPTNQNKLANDAYEGGVLLPFAVNLQKDISLTMQTGVQLIKNIDNKGYRPAFSNNIAITKSFANNFSSYVELATYKDKTDFAKWKNTFDLGVVYNVSENFSIDCGAYLGISKYADDVALFSGFAYRL